MEVENEYTDEYGVRYGLNKKILKYVPNGLTAYSIMEGCTVIDLEALIECRTLKELTLPKSICQLYKGVFDGCPNLQKLTLFCEGYFQAQRYRMDSGWGFEYFLEEYENIKEVYIVPWSILANFIVEYELPYLSIKYIDEERLNVLVQNDCTFNSDKTILISDESDLETIHIQQGVKRICAKAFENNSKIKELILPDSIESIDSDVFYNCSELEKVIVLADHFSSFNVAPNIKEVYVPIGTKPFYDTLKNRHDKFEIKEFPLSEENSRLSGNSCIYSTNGQRLLSGKNNTSKVVIIKAGTREICEHAFQGNIQIEELIISSSVNQIGYGAFENCKNLRRIILNTSWTIKIEPNWLDGCENLHEFYVPKSEADILINGGYSEVYDLPEHYTKEIWVDTQTHLIYDETKKTLVFIPKLVAKDLVNFTVPDFVEEIHMRAFDNCKRLETITLSKNIKDITGAPFCMCPNLKNIYAQGKLFKDYDGILYTVDKRELISYPPKRYINKYQVQDGIIKIRDYAFANHEEMINIKLPDSLVSIGEWAFAGTRLIKIILPENMKIIGANAFNSNIFTNTVFLGNSIEIIGRDAFKPQAYNGEAEAWVPLNSKSFFEELGKNACLPNVVEKESHELDEVQWAIEQDFNPVKEKKFKEELVEPNITNTKKANNNWGCLGVLIIFIFMVAIYML